ncbi:hypothetical protein P8452_34939 [Trifolium repens]|nr:hypothetical protein P8452_34939 [Trifolium repens]
MDNNTMFLTDHHVPLRLSLLKGKNEKSHNRRQAPISLFTSLQFNVSHNDFLSPIYPLSTSASFLGVVC